MGLPVIFGQSHPIYLPFSFPDISISSNILFGSGKLIQIDNNLNIFYNVHWLTLKIKTNYKHCCLVQPANAGGMMPAYHHFRSGRNGNSKQTLLHRKRNLFYKTGKIIEKSI
jgi:hypothetical protein